MFSMELLEEALKRIYGPQKTAHMMAVVVPGIMVDFMGMLNKLSPGQSVTEEYQVDDGMSVIKLAGRKDDNGQPEITDAVCEENSENTAKAGACHCK